MENKNVSNNATLTIRPSAAAFFSKGKTIEPSTTTTAKAAPAMRPSAAAFFGQNKAIDSHVATKMKPNRKPEVFVDLSTLTNHSAITIVNNKSISIYIEMCGLMAEQPTNMATLLAALPEYKSVKKLTLKIHAPWPKSESREFYNNRLSSIKKLFAIIDTFNLYTLKKY
ncbi:hypothetical protein BCON_0153g00060 [Botryotinia convoluta]|uniref:Uncharacterized protein n=1 Tax=Botryotinia convoluta TaxID=54673 RepID=A0A4Z1HZE8_9HELO|nr:hypothetical protein BCON_0153g00060 [Botryotinia convoluta]